MRPVEFTPEAIIKAGQDLQTAGRNNITGFALRQKVGGGNPARLKQVWDEYQHSQTTSVAEPVSELPKDVAEAVSSISKSLTDRIAGLAVELNNRAVKAADRRVDEVVRSAGEQRAQAERELADAAEAIDDLEVKLDELQTKLEEVQADRDSVREALAKAAGNMEAMQAQIAGLMQALVVLKHVDADIKLTHAADFQ